MMPVEGMQSGQKQPDKTNDSNPGVRFAPGFLLGSIGETGALGFGPLLPERRCHPIVEESLQQYLAATTWFQNFTPQYGGYKSFFCSLLEAKDALLRDVARSRTQLEMMESIHATMAKLLAKYAVMAAKPRNEAALLESLRREGHRAVASVLMDLSTGPSLRGRNEKQKKPSKPNGYLESMFFPVIKTETKPVQGYQCGPEEEQCESAPINGCSWEHVALLDGLEGGRCASTPCNMVKGGCPSLLQTGDCGRGKDYEAYKEDNATHPTTAGTWGIQPSARSESCNPHVLNPQAGWYRAGDTRSSDYQLLPANGEVFAQRAPGHNACNQGVLMGNNSRFNERLLPGFDAPGSPPVPGSTDRGAQDLRKCAPIRVGHSPPRLPVTHEFCGETDSPGVWSTGLYIFRRLPDRLGFKGGVDAGSWKDPESISQVGTGSIPEVCLGTEPTSIFPRTRMETQYEGSLSWGWQEDRLYTEDRGDANGKTGDTICSPTAEGEAELHHECDPGRETIHTKPSQVGEKLPARREADWSAVPPSKKRFEMVEENISRGGQELHSQGSNKCNSDNRCFSGGSGALPADRRQEMGVFNANSTRETEACELVRTSCSSESVVATPGETKRSPCQVVDRQHDSCCVIEEGCNLKSVNGVAKISKGNPDNVLSQQHTLSGEAHAGFIERSCRPLVQTVTRVVDSGQNYCGYNTESRAIGTGPLCLTAQCKVQEIPDEGDRCIFSGLEGPQVFSSTTDRSSARGSKESKIVGGSSTESTCTSLEKFVARPRTLLDSHKCEFDALRERLLQLEIQAVPGGGILHGGAREDLMDGEITSITHRIFDSVEIRSRVAATRKRMASELGKFMKFAKVCKAGNPSDTVVLYAFSRVGRTSGNRISTVSAQIVRMLSIAGFELDKNVMVRVREIMKYANLICPKEDRAADPVSLTTIYKLMDRTIGEKITPNQARALDILLISYATMSRLGEVAELKTEDIFVSEIPGQAPKVALHPKPLVATGERIKKMVPKAVGVDSWCPLQILMEYYRIAVEEGKTYVFSYGRDVPPRVGSIDKALRALTNKYLPGYTLRITGHSARKGAALEACAAGIPEAFIQAQGGWADPVVCRSYMGSAWAQINSTFTEIEKRITLVRGRQTRNR